MDWYTLRFRFQFWLMQCWPFRVLAWLLSKGVPEEKGFAKFKGARVGGCGKQRVPLTPARVMRRRTHWKTVKEAQAYRGWLRRTRAYRTWLISKLERD
jgi:hypothetical protein